MSAIVALSKRVRDLETDVEQPEYSSFFHGVGTAIGGNLNHWFVMPWDITITDYGIGRLGPNLFAGNFEIWSQSPPGIGVANLELSVPFAIGAQYASGSVAIDIDAPVLLWSLWGAGAGGALTEATFTFYYRRRL